jgi:eukaryotic-like serine/threonine-protein kinase
MSLQIPGYAELAQIGEGPTGTVMLARYQATGAVAAIKHLSLQMVRDQVFMERFRADARVLKGLRHPKLVSLYDFVEDGAEAAVLSELADGVSLRTMMQTYGRIEPEASLVVLLDLLAGLEQVHGAGLVHRACKPENMIVTGEGEVRLLDTGVAVQSGVAQWRSGMQRYMAPEQWADGPASPSTDLYAVAAVSFECVSGRAPFQAEELTELRLQHEVAPVPVELAPMGVRELLQRGLDKDPLRRFASAAAFAASLRTAALAAYGEDWEERGRRRLASMALGLDALFPLTMFAGLLAGVGTNAQFAAAAVAAAGAAEGAAARRRMSVYAVGAAILVCVVGLGIIGGMALGHVGPFGSSHSPLAGSSPGASPSAGASASAQPSDTSSPFPTDTPSPSASASPSPTPTATPRPSSSPSPSPTPKAVLAVTQLALASGSPTVSHQCQASADALVNTNGAAGTVTVTFQWTYDTATRKDVPGSQQTMSIAFGAGQTAGSSGQSTFAVPADAIEVHVTVSSAPAAPSNPSSSAPVHKPC